MHFLFSIASNKETLSTPQLLKLALGYDIMNVVDTIGETAMNCTHRLLARNDNINLHGESINII
jgi:hypothetical protein